MLSVVIPVHNEEGAVLPLYERLTATLTRLERPYEILFLDDASTDRSLELLRGLVEADSHVRVVRLRRHFGHTAALSAGFHESRGTILITMDGTLRHAPEDIPLLVEKIDQGYDIVSGSPVERDPGAFLRKLPMQLADAIMTKASGIALRAFNSNFKAYRAEVLKDVNLYGELHRFIPALAGYYGARIAEVPVSRPPRGSKRPHHGIGRAFRVVFDILTVKFFLKYFTRPMHFFGLLGLCGTLSGGGILAYLLVKGLLGYDIVVENGPGMIAGALILLAGLMMFATGLIGEMAMRTYFESQGRHIYAIREIRTRKIATP